MRKRLFGIIVALFVAIAGVCAFASPAIAGEGGYSHVGSETAGDVTLAVSYNDPVAGQPLTLHVSASGGSGQYKYYMSAPFYYDTDGSYDSVMDPAHMPGYTGVQAETDYQFTPMASGVYQFQFQVMDMANTGLYLRKTVSVKVSDSNYPSVSNRVAKAVAQCNAETDGSEYEKALWLHDWLLEQLEYDNSLTWSSAESALCRGTGTCQAYEEAYSKLLATAGIENEETRDAGDGHTWNAVKIDDEWCQVDCTWDDTSDNWYGFDQRHLYFGLNDDLMAIAHGKWKGSDGSTYGAHETTLANNYFVRNGEAQKWADAYAPEIQQHLDARETSFSVAATNANDSESISGIINGIVASELNEMRWETSSSEVDVRFEASAAAFSVSASYRPKGFTSGHPGWNLDNGTWYYCDSTGQACRGWAYVNGSWYYLDLSTGAMKTGWLDDGGARYYLDPSGAMKTGWQFVSGQWFYLEPSGAMVAGWKWLGNWYYLGASGAMASGWLDLNGAWYYLNQSGAMQTGWLSYCGSWYFLDSSGLMQTGWISTGGAWYHMEGSGAMQTGWLLDGGTWYLLGGSGAMQVGWQLVGGTWYYFFGNGSMAKGWQVIGGTWYYFYDSGAMASNAWVGNYYLSGSGAMATNQWIGPYYVGSDGAWIPGYGQGPYYRVGNSDVYHNHWCRTMGSVSNYQTYPTLQSVLASGAKRQCRNCAQMD